MFVLLITAAVVNQNKTELLKFILYLNSKSSSNKLVEKKPISFDNLKFHQNPLCPMDIAFKSSRSLPLNKVPPRLISSPHPCKISVLKSKRFPPMAALTAASPAVGLSETFNKLRQQSKVALIPYITAGDPDLSTTAEALKVLSNCGSDIIELGVPYSDPLADGPVIQAAATRSLARETNFNAIISMLKGVIPELSCPVSLFSYYNPILKRGIENFMMTIKDAGVRGLVVPDVPLEETEILRKEAVKYNIELVLLTTPTTPKDRMKDIVEASEGFVYLVSSVGVTGARTSVNGRVQTLLGEIKEVTEKPVAVGFGISKPEHVKQVAGWGADGIIVGSAMVKLLGEAQSSEEGLKELENFTKSLRSALS